MQTRGKPIKSVDKFYRWICDKKPVCYNPDPTITGRPNVFLTAEEIKKGLYFFDTIKEIRSGQWFEVDEK